MMKSRILIVISAIFVLGACATPATKNQNTRTAAENNSHRTLEMPPESSDSGHSHNHPAADPHMRMTEIRDEQPGDTTRAEEIAVKARTAIEKYKDYRVALQEGFEILLPEVQQPMYHFNKLANYIEAESRFDPARPTSLLYEKDGEGYRLIGVMYTAPAGMIEDELNKRVPLSTTAWHQHVNICLPKGSDTFSGLIGQGSQFGIEGSIATKEECDRAGGQFLPRFLGWMVHLYPFEQTVEEMWSVKRQMNPNRQ